MKYEIKGNIKLKGDMRPFVINMDAESESHLKDKVMAYFGSKYGVKRTAIEIKEIKK